MPNSSELPAVDAEAFLEDLKVLRREIDGSLGPADLAHLRRIERIGKLATALGLATAWALPNPLSMAALALGRSTRWLLMHHIGHRGYDSVPGVPPRYTSRVFARGRRRFLDWADWMLPEAWIYEHNVLHHSHTGEERDPDLIERNLEALRGAPWPRPLKYAAMGLLAATWRASYYAPTTFRAWRNRHGDTGPHHRELWGRCFAPYAWLHFVALPAAYLPLGPVAGWSALVNSLGAEVLTNLHTFAVVGPNHTGEDLFRFDSRPASKAEGMVRQVLGSTNYRCGTDLIDYAQLWLNYQIEHHLFPDLPMLKYQEIQRQVKRLCQKHGVPYVQEGVFTRIRKMLDVAVGARSMKRAAATPLAPAWIPSPAPRPEAQRSVMRARG